MRCLALAVVIGAVIIPSRSHGHGDADWIQRGGSKSPSNGIFCCGPTYCARIPKDRVRLVAGGYAVKIDDQHSAIIPFSQVLPSDDDDFWGCASPEGVRCFFAPPLGV